MKHPILYRVAFYSILGILCGSILFLTTMMADAPFRSRDMRNAYFFGCEYGSRPLTDKLVDQCARTSDMYKQTLDDLDKQMEKLGDRTK